MLTAVSRRSGTGCLKTFLFLIFLIVLGITVRQADFFQRQTLPVKYFLKTSDFDQDRLFFTKEHQNKYPQILLNTPDVKILPTCASDRTKALSC